MYSSPYGMMKSNCIRHSVSRLLPPPLRCFEIVFITESNLADVLAPRAHRENVNLNLSWTLLILGARAH